MTLSLPVDELYVVGGVVGFVSGGGGIEIGGDVLLSQASDHFRQRTFNKLPLLADDVLVWTMDMIFHSFCLLLLLLLPPRAAALDGVNHPTTPGILPRRLHVRRCRPRRISSE